MLTSNIVIPVVIRSSVGFSSVFLLDVCWIENSQINKQTKCDTSILEGKILSIENFIAYKLF